MITSAFYPYLSCLAGVILGASIAGGLCALFMSISSMSGFRTTSADTSQQQTVKASARLLKTTLRSGLAHLVLSICALLFGIYVASRFMWGYW